LFKVHIFESETQVFVQKICGNETMNRSNIFGGILDLEKEGRW